MINREEAQYTILGRRLREIREHRGLTREQLAERMHTSVAMIGRWEASGTRDTAVRFHRWTQISRTLKVAPYSAFEPLGTPVKSARGVRLRRRSRSTIFKPLTFDEAQHLLQCGPRTLQRLIKNGHLEVVLVRCVEARSLFACIAKRAGYNGG